MNTILIYCIYILSKLKFTNSWVTACQSQLLLLISLFLLPVQTYACTVASAVAPDGQVWNANNEDGHSGVANFINVFPKTVATKFGYYTLSYLSPELGKGGSIQGGMNEAGLAFDFNTIDYIHDFDAASKKSFEPGDDAILPHILGNMSSVDEVIKFFDAYWFTNGFRSAQMHVADSHGRFAIISASGVKLVENGKFLVSTNFDICGNQDGSTCSRYPVATAILSQSTASLSTMLKVCRETAQGKGTLYSNIHNLTTGEVWFFSQHDPGTTVQTNISDMLDKGRKSYTFSNLNSLIEERPIVQKSNYTTIELDKNLLEKYAGTYSNNFTGSVEVQYRENGLLITFADGNSAIFSPYDKDNFCIPGENVRVKFDFDEERKQATMNLYENGFWLFLAIKEDI